MGIEYYLPEKIRKEYLQIKEEALEEIRVRIGQPVEWIFGNCKKWGRVQITEEEMEELLNYLTEYSWHAMEEQMKQGFFTINGGYRVGIAGRTEYQGIGRNISCMTDVNAVNIRIASEKKGCAKELVRHIRAGDFIFHTLIISLPGVGKTTLLRDCIRILSGGFDGKRALKVGVVDERSEIAASFQGKFQNDLGPQTDVLDNCPKVEGMRMLLRSMSPEVIAVDELGSREDFQAVEEIINSGIFMIGTVHAQKMSEVKQRMEQYGCDAGQRFERYVLLEKTGEGKRRIQIFSGDGTWIC